MCPSRGLVRVRSAVTALALSAVAAPGCRPAARSASAGDSGAVAAPRPLATLPPIRHVFVIVLENQSYDVTFGPRRAAPYLADTLPAAGALLRRYYATGHNSLDNYVALISGIAPNPRTQADCPRYEEFRQTGTAPDGQPIGTGCIYPAGVLTIANQLEARGLTWKGYLEDMGNIPAREAPRCGHPVPGTEDRTERAALGDQYATKHDPFVYFHAVLDGPSCERNVAPLTELAADLQSPGSTPSYAFIVPNLCHDGHDARCVDGTTGGLPAIDGFLRRWVPLITRSPAYAAGGLLIITFDEALGSDASACCGEPTGPNTRFPGVSGPGGGRVGAVLLSRFIRPGTVSDVAYNHYALLRSVEDAFGLAHLGYAAQPGLASFGADVYTDAAAQ